MDKPLTKLYVRVLIDKVSNSIHFFDKELNELEIPYTVYTNDEKNITFSIEDIPVNLKFKEK